MKKPLIGVTPSLDQETKDSTCRPTYLAAIRHAGGIPVILPLKADKEDLEQLVETLDGFLFTGGPDIHPFYFGEETHEKCGNVSPERDQMELALLPLVMAAKKPVLGICRGLQLVNVAFGGSLYQDLSYKNPDHMLHSQKQNRDYLIHQVTMDADSHLASILGAEPVYTNTMHHQCVKEPGKGLKITAHTADGIPEAMETDGGQFILVQWHPEELQDSEPRMRGLFKNLIEKASK